MFNCYQYLNGLIRLILQVKLLVIRI